MFKSPIVYLERQDFTATGNLVAGLVRKPAFVMIQSNACGHCTAAKPAFQQLAASADGFNCMTIQADGERQSERDLVPMLPTIYPNFRGYPSYILFRKNKPRVAYTGPRDAASMHQFVQNHI